MECVSGLHHNKAKTNYHIHLIFSERRLLPEPEVKIASRSMFYDEAGKHVRTKKEITGEDGQIRPGCTIIKKGEVYESHMFSIERSNIYLWQKVLCKKGKKWYYRFYIEDESGNRVQKEYPGTKSKSETEALLRKAMEDYEEKRFVAKAESEAIIRKASG